MYIFILALPRSLNYSISVWERCVGHVTLRIFGIPSNISPKLVKLESSKLVHSFILVLPTSVNYNISVFGRGVGHVTPRIFGIPSNISPSYTAEAR